MRPTKIETMMEMAVVMARRSTCSRLQVGCIITNLDTLNPGYSHTRILAMGYNGMEAGGKNECDSSEPGKCGCIHAEQNALIKAEPGPKAAFVTTSPCMMCARLLVNAQVQWLFFLTAYRDLEGVRLLTDRGIRVTEMSR